MLVKACGLVMVDDDTSLSVLQSLFRMGQGWSFTTSLAAKLTSEHLSLSYLLAMCYLKSCLIYSVNINVNCKVI